MGGLSRERWAALAGGQAAKRREFQIEVGFARPKTRGSRSVAVIGHRLYSFVRVETMRR
jgi:hypothetical protein